MADPTTLAERAKRNGGSHSAGGGGRGLNGRLAPLGALARGGGSVARVGGGLLGGGRRATAQVLGGAAKRARRALTADLDDRDPDYIRENLPLAWLLATLWYRAEVRNMGNVPEQGPVLLVGNHTGGNMAPEVIVLPLAFSTYFGVERPFYQLAHNLVLASPIGPFLRRYGTMAASHEHAEQALDAGRRGARLPRRRLGGPPALAGRATRSTSPAARASSGWRSTPTCRSSPWSRSAARRRRSSSAAAPGSRS